MAQQTQEHMVIFGTGYVGLVTGACLAELGHHVACVDSDSAKIFALNQGQCPIYEPNLSQLIQKNREQQRLAFHELKDVTSILKNSTCVVVAVGTPVGPDGRASLDAVHSVMDLLGQQLSRPTLILMKSTVPVGSCDKLEQQLTQQLRQRDQTFTCDLVSHPEFLRQGSAVHDSLHPARIIVGAESAQVHARARKIYQPLIDRGARTIEMDRRSSELTKYAANAFLATKISFMNEMSRLCETWNADIESVREGIGSDPRIGSEFLRAGIGFGGSCFPKDIQALISHAKMDDVPTPLIIATQNINASQRKRFFDGIQKYFKNKNGLAGKTIGIWGLAFKPETDDLRDAPSVEIVRWLLEAGAQVKAHDPAAMAQYKRLKLDVTLCENPIDAAANTDALVLLTEWGIYKNQPWTHIKSKMKSPVLFDARNLFHTIDGGPLNHGFELFSVGRPPFLK